VIYLQRVRPENEEAVTVDDKSQSRNSAESEGEVVDSNAANELAGPNLSADGAVNAGDDLGNE
jgi:hypothetical protein